MPLVRVPRNGDSAGCAGRNAGERRASLVRAFQVKHYFAAFFILSTLAFGPAWKPFSGSDHMLGSRRDGCCQCLPPLSVNLMLHRLRAGAGTGSNRSAGSLSWNVPEGSPLPWHDGVLPVVTDAVAQWPPAQQRRGLAVTPALCTGLKPLRQRATGPVNGKSPR